MDVRQKSALISFAIATGLMAAVSIGSALAQPQTVQGPILDPRTGSYFALHDRRDLRLDGPNWKEALTVVSAESHQGRRGRLAVVDSPESLQFIAKSFKLPGETWIGLRYFCRFRKLLWTNGESQPLQEIATMWAPQWHRGKVTCAAQPSMQYMPVYLTSSISGPPKFQASGIAKRFYFVLVEYPAPEQPAPPAER